jgi:hypothetical protein
MSGMATDGHGLVVHKGWLEFERLDSDKCSRTATAVDVEGYRRRSMD